MPQLPLDRRRAAAVGQGPRRCWARTWESQVQTRGLTNFSLGTSYALPCSSSKEQRLEAGRPPGQVLTLPSTRATWPWKSQPAHLRLSSLRLTRWPRTEPARHPKSHGGLQLCTWARVCLRHWHCRPLSDTSYLQAPPCE